MGHSHNPKFAFTPVELTLMRSVWDGNRTTRQIYDALPAPTRKRLAFSTISTYLLRMVQKGYLKREPTEGREYVYVALVEKQAVQDQMLDETRALFGKDSDLLNRFAGRTEMSSDEQRLLNELKKKMKDRGR